MIIFVIINPNPFVEWALGFVARDYACVQFRPHAVFPFSFDVTVYL